jgi:phosphomevalonate kinase
VSYKQARLIREEEETILDLLRELALAYSQIANLKSDNSFSSKCDCSSAVWTEVIAKYQCRIRRLHSIEDLKFSVSLSNEFEAVALSQPSKVVQVMNRENPKSRLSKKKCKKVVLLGSGHGRGLHDQLHSTVGD